ncbi:MAG: hypothetical protein RL272_1159, partial [Candidatus Parcubacteria bacterium]
LRSVEMHGLALLEDGNPARLPNTDLFPTKPDFSQNLLL